MASRLSVLHIARLSLPQTQVSRIQAKRENEKLKFLRTMPEKQKTNTRNGTETAWWESLRSMRQRECQFIGWQMIFSSAPRRLHFLVPRWQVHRWMSYISFENSLTMWMRETI